MTDLAGIARADLGLVVRGPIGLVRRLVARLVAWLNEPVLVANDPFSHFDAVERADLPVHHPARDA